jgi:hypothetical protein
MALGSQRAIITFIQVEVFGLSLIETISRRTVGLHQWRRGKESCGSAASSFKDVDDNQMRPLSAMSL